MYRIKSVCKQIRMVSESLRQENLYFWLKKEKGHEERNAEDWLDDRMTGWQETSRKEAKVMEEDWVMERNWLNKMNERWMMDEQW